MQTPSINTSPIHYLPPASFSQFLICADVSSHVFRYNRFPSQNFYEILGVRFDSSLEDITSAYRREALKWHPDKNMDVEECGKREKIAERFKAINHAGSILRNQESRREYDNQAFEMPDNYSAVPETMTHRQAMQLFFELFISCLKARQALHPSPVHFFASLSLPLFLGAFGGVNGAVLGFAVASALNREGVEQIVKDLTDEQRIALYQAARLLVERELA